MRPRQSLSGSRKQRQQNPGSHSGLARTLQRGCVSLSHISSELAGSTAWLPLLPDSALLENQCLLGAIWHDAAAGRMKMQPLSIVTDRAIALLLY